MKLVPLCSGTLDVYWSVWMPFYLVNGNFYTSQIASLYGDSPQWQGTMTEQFVYRTWHIILPNSPEQVKLPVGQVDLESYITLGGTARWLQLQPSSAWPRPTVSAFQYFRWCALTEPAVSHFLRWIYSLSKEEALQSLLMSLSTLVFWLFDVENIRRHDGCNKWWRWLQLMFREWWRGLHDSFDELVPLITQEICFKYFLKLSWNTL